MIIDLTTVDDKKSSLQHQTEQEALQVLGECYPMFSWYVEHSGDGSVLYIKCPSLYERGLLNVHQYGMGIPVKDLHSAKIRRPLYWRAGGELIERAWASMSGQRSQVKYDIEP